MLKVFDRFAGRAYGHTVWRNVAGDDGSGTDYGSFSNGYAGHDDAADSDMGTVFYLNGGVFQGEVHDGHAYLVLAEVALVAEQLAACGNPYPLSNGNQVGARVVDNDGACDFGPLPYFYAAHPVDAGGHLCRKCELRQNGQAANPDAFEDVAECSIVG